MTRAMRIDDLLDLEIPAEATVAPDGQQIIYTLQRNDGDLDRTTTCLWAVRAGGEARAITSGPADACPAISPDGRTVAFLRDGQPWSIPVDGGEPAQIAELSLGASALAWSPDGRSIAALADVDLDAPNTSAEKTADASRPIVVNTLDAQLDGVGYRRGVRTHLHVIDVARGAVRRLTDGEGDVQGFGWSPDSRQLAYIARPAGSTELDLRSAVHLVAAAGTAGPRLVAFAEGMAQTVSYTPDGARLVVLGRQDVSGGHAGVFVVDGGTGDAVRVAPELDRNARPGGPSYPGARPVAISEDKVVFAALDGGYARLYVAPLDGGPSRGLGDSGECGISGLSFGGGTAVTILATPESFGEVALIDLESGVFEPITAHGAAHSGIRMHRRERRWFQISDGSSVEGWILRNENSTGRGPLLLDIHGGPHNAWNALADAEHLEHQELVECGWTILMVNPRGSDGYGEAFYTGVDGAWGEADRNDFLEPIDVLVAEGLVDPARIVVTGYSYGGYMACELPSRDNRFVAAVAGGVMCDLVSGGGAADDIRDINVLELGLFPWRAADHERLWELSPLSRAQHVQTPTLILHGAADLRCPIGQAQQWFSALREHQVQTQLVVYPDASHEFGRVSHRIDYARRVAEWAQRYAGEASGERPAPLPGDRWQRRLTELAEKHGVPGAQLGVLRFGDGHSESRVELATGTLNLAFGDRAPVTLDSVFQIGSITKVWTTTAAIRLIEQGKFGLDTPVLELLPELRPSAMYEGVTVRHLMNHTSGLDGDVFTDTGRGDDCVARYVEQLGEFARVFPVGASWAYCNSGFVLLGRIIERATGKVWDEAMRELLCDPLGLRNTVTLPEEALLRATAVGHEKSGGVLAPVSVWGLPRAMGPAGLISSTVGDLLSFAALHLRGGVAADGTRLLTEEHVAAMQAHETNVPATDRLTDSWGLGWIRFTWGGGEQFGHDGATLGQFAYLVLDARNNVAFALLTNGGDTEGLYEDLAGEVLGELVGISLPEKVQPVVGDAERWSEAVADHLGTYEAAEARVEVFSDEEGLRVRQTYTGPLVELETEPIIEHRALPAGSDRLLTRLRGDDDGPWETVTFSVLPSGERIIHIGVRAMQRVAATN